MAVPKPKLCKDCRWSLGAGLPGRVFGARPICRAPTGEVSLVTGLAYVGSSSCERRREYNGGCGPEGRHFTPRPPSRTRRILAALGLTTLTGCSGDADAVIVALATAAPLIAVWLRGRLRRPA